MFTTMSMLRAKRGAKMRECGHDTCACRAAAAKKKRKDVKTFV